MIHPLQRSEQSLPEHDALAAPDAEAAFVAMVETHYARLGAFALRLVGSRSAAEDVVHEVLLRVWRRREEFAFDEPLRYLYQAVRNEAESWHRRELRLRRRQADGELADLRPDPRAGIEGVVEANDLIRVVEETVAQLPPRRREIFRMQREQGLTYAQIASLLGISTKTVEIQIGHALKAIRRRVIPLLSVSLVLLS
jgi:RNA polymerase sigma-70 factor (ECF subfamily)